MLFLKQYTRLLPSLLYASGQNMTVHACLSLRNQRRVLRVLLSAPAGGWCTSAFLRTHPKHPAQRLPLVTNLLRLYQAESRLQQLPSTWQKEDALKEVCTALLLLPLRSSFCSVGPDRGTCTGSCGLMLHCWSQRTQAVPTFQLGAFLLEHANLITPLAGGGGSHVIQATQLAQQQLQAEVGPCLVLLALKTDS